MSLKLLLWNDLCTHQFTDCTFIFKIKGTNNEPEMEKLLHAHKLILSLNSPVFEAMFKSEWNETKKHFVTPFKYSVFEKMLQVIYLGHNRKQEIDNIEEAWDLYEAIHFYQADTAKNLLIPAILIYFYCNVHECKISQLIEKAIFFQDKQLLDFLRDNLINILKNPEFLNLTPETINSLYQLENKNAPAVELFIALEVYIEDKGETCINLLKPAIESVRFEYIPKDRIVTTTILTTEEKNNILKDERRFGSHSRVQLDMLDKEYLVRVRDNSNSSEIKKWYL